MFLRLLMGQGGVLWLLVVTVFRFVLVLVVCGCLSGCLDGLLLDH